MTDRLVQAALAGTNGSGTEPPRAETPADALGEGRGLLLQAGLRDIYRQAGYVSPDAPEPVPPAPDVPEAVCPPVVESPLREMIEHGPGLPSAPREAYRALARRGWVLPTSVLVPALSSQLRLPELLPVLGERGRWLAALNGAWQWAVAGEQAPAPLEAERIWTEGTKAERVALIRRLRESDVTGARARVAACFASEPADLRQDLVRALEISLSHDDEPFLEAVLDDRSKGVRQAAAALLARLPESAFAGRMVTRAGRLVAQRRLRRGVVLHPVSELPEDWRRDGIGTARPGGIGEELTLAIQVLCSVPAAVLIRELDVSLEEVIEAADRGGADSLIDAWSRSVAPDERETLLPLLWDIWWTKPLQRTTGEGTLVSLARTMPRDALRQRVLRLLEDPPDGTEHFTVSVLDEMDGPWPADISRSALDLVRQWLDRRLRNDRNAGDWPQLIRPLAAYAAPETIDQALELLAIIERTKAAPAWIAGVRQGADVLRLRRRFWNAMATAVIESMTRGGAIDGGYG